MTAGPQFFQTMMGRQFYDGTVPELVRQLKRIADALEKQAPRQPEPTQGPSLEVPKEPTPVVPAGPPPEKSVSRLLDVTTGHVSKEGAEFLDRIIEDTENHGFWLDGPDGPRAEWVPVYSRGVYGWFLGVPQNLEKLSGEPGAETVITLLKYARAHNIDWVLLDCDSDDIQGYTLYNW